VQKLDYEDAHQQKHLPSLKPAQVRQQEKLRNNQPVVVVLVPQPGESGDGSSVGGEM
jgi:hypothetical protein